MTKIFFFLLLFVSQTILAQNLPKQSLIDDLTYLNKAVVNGHPINYNPNIKINIEPVIELAKKIKTDSITLIEYTYWVEKAIYHIGCIHTSIHKNTLINKLNASTFIPLTAIINDKNLIITSCEDSTKIGEQITSINGLTNNEILDPFKEFKASDGKSDAFSKAYFHFASSKLIATVLQNPTIFSVKTTEGTFSLNATNKPYKQPQPLKITDYLLSNNSNQLFVADNVCVLRINSFAKSDKHFFKEAFKKISELKAKKLLIDLRQNLGGYRNAAVELTKYIVDTTFSYSILQPNLNTRRYLNGKGKFYLFLSKLKYNVGAIFKKHKTIYGNEYTYHYASKKENHFGGKVYVLTDGFTASAATMATSWLKQFSNATFIGNQAGGGYNGNNGGSFPIITLPQSKIEIVFPAYRLILDNKSETRTGIFPDIPIKANTEIKEIIKIINQN